MEHEQDPQHQTQPNKDDGPVEPRLEPSQPGLGAPSGERLGHAEADAEGDSILARLARQAARIDTLSANLEQHRNEFRDAEVALVTRIADVDDDRRLTATRLQRSWQSYRDEVEDGFKRRRSMLVGILLLFGILVSISLGYFYAKFDQTRKTLAAETAELRHAIQQLQMQIPDRAIQSQLTQEKLSQLSVAIKSISMSLKNINKMPTVAVETQHSEPVSAASSPAVDQVKASGDAIQEDRQRLQQDHPLAAATDSGDSRPAPLYTEPTPMQEIATDDAPPLPVLKSEPITDEIAPPEPRATAADAASGGEPEATVAPARIDIDEKPYALQLIGFFSLEDLHDYVRRSSLPAPLYYQEETYRGRPWFVLIHSLHPSRESANSAIATLPPKLAKLDLWVRKLDADATLVPLESEPNH